MPAPESNNSKPFLYYLFFVLVALILVDKTLYNKSSRKNTISQRQINASFINDGYIPEIKGHPGNAVNDGIPVVGEEDLNKANVFEAEEESSQGIYFLKFYNVGNKSFTKLVKVNRTLKGSLQKRIKLALKELKKGPNQEEQEKGVLNALPISIKYSKNVKLIGGVLHISLDEKFHKGAGKELMQDRIDQLTHTLFEFKEIKSVKIYIDKKEAKFLGKDNYKVPALLTRKQRKIVYL